MTFNPWKSIAYEDLPPTMRELADQIGLGATLILMERYRGRKMYIPLKVNPQREGRDGDHWLVEAIGPELAGAISFAKPGGYIKFPYCRGLIRRIVIAHQKLEERRKTNEVARSHGVCECTVRRILKSRQGVTRAA